MKLKPKVFIASSSEGKKIADAIDASLPEAEVTIWNTGFPLSEQTVNSLMQNAHDADFGIFVLSDDDIADIRGQKVTIARDNVIYELGLFTGVLGQSRCFFLLPQDIKLPFHLPTDLQGITFATYPKRFDGNWEASVNPFCSKVKARFNQGYRLYEAENYLMELATHYDCCDWIDDTASRVARKDGIWQQMCSHVRGNKGSVSKLMLLKQGRISCYVLLSAIIKVQPEPDDLHLLLAINASKLNKANAQHKIAEAISSLSDRGLLSANDKTALQLWVSDMPKVNDVVLTKIAKILGN